MYFLEKEKNSIVIINTRGKDVQVIKRNVKRPQRVVRFLPEYSSRSKTEPTTVENTEGRINVHVQVVNPGLCSCRKFLKPKNACGLQPS